MFDWHFFNYKITLYSSAEEIFFKCRENIFRVRSNNFSDAVEEVLGCVLAKSAISCLFCVFIHGFLCFRVSGCQNTDVQRAAPCFHRVTRVTGG